MGTKIGRLWVHVEWAQGPAHGVLLGVGWRGTVHVWSLTRESGWQKEW